MSSIEVGFVNTVRKIVSCHDKCDWRCFLPKSVRLSVCQDCIKPGGATIEITKLGLG